MSGKNIFPPVVQTPDNLSNIAEKLGESGKLSDEDKAQVAAYLELMKLNSQLATVPPRLLRGHPLEEMTSKLQDILYVAAANLKDRTDTNAGTLRENFIIQRILVIKSRLCSSGGGWIEQKITWKNKTITESIAKKLLSEGFTVDFCSIDYDSDGEYNSSKISTLDDANAFYVCL